LPATIRSRCASSAWRSVAELAAQWLQQEQSTPVDPRLVHFSGGAPLKALAYADGSFDTLNQQMQGSLSDLLREKRT